MHKCHIVSVLRTLSATALRPVEVLLAGAELEVATGDAEVGLHVARKRAAGGGNDLGLLSGGGGGEVGEVELLLVDGRRSLARGLHSGGEPGRRVGADIAELLDGLGLVAVALGPAIA